MYRVLILWVNIYIIFVNFLLLSKMSQLGTQMFVKFLLDICQSDAKSLKCIVGLKNESIVHFLGLAISVISLDLTYPSWVPLIVNNNQQQSKLSQSLGGIANYEQPRALNLPEEHYI